jgi:hypothetical protein
MTNDQLFLYNSDSPAPTVDIKAVQAVADDLNAALAAQEHGGTAATAGTTSRSCSPAASRLKIFGQQ